MFSRILKKKKATSSNSDLTLKKFTPKNEEPPHKNSPITPQLDNDNYSDSFVDSRGPEQPSASKITGFSNKSLTPLTKHVHRGHKSASSSPVITQKLRSSRQQLSKGGMMKGTSFSSMQNLSISCNNLSASEDNFFSPHSNNSSPFSFSSSSSSQNSSPSPSVLSLSGTTKQLKHHAEQSKSRSSVHSTNSSTSHQSGKNRKKFHLFRKGSLKRQSSKEENRAQLRQASSMHNLNFEDPKPTSDLLEKFREDYKALEIEVREKDEEVHRLNATIDQVNMTWKEKDQAVMQELEDARRKNDQLRAILSKQNASSQAKANKPALRIPVNQKSKSKSVSSLVEIPHSASRNESPTTSMNIAKVASPHSNRKGVREPVRKMGVVIRPGAKSDDVRQNLLQSLMSSSCLCQLSSSDLFSIVDVMKSKRINKGERLMHEGAPGQAFYVLAEGECRIYKQNQESISPNLSSSGRPVKHWEVFGEAEVFYHTRRVWSCKCVLPGTVWYITRDEFKSAIMQQDIIQRQKKEIFSFLKRVKSLEKLEVADLKMLANMSRIVQFAKGDYIIRQGSSLTTMYVIKEGEVTVTKIIDGSETRLETLVAGQLVGAFTFSNRHQHNAVASGKEVIQCVAIPSKHFEKVRDRVSFSSNDVTLSKVNASLAVRDYLGDGQDSLSSGKTGSSSGYGSDPNSPDSRRHTQTRYDDVHGEVFEEITSSLKDKTFEDFQTVALVGKGAFGSVTLSKLKKDDGNAYAVKKLSKQDVVASEQQQNVFSEKEIQMQSSRHCPFIVSLYTTFKDNKFVYFVMEFCPGGELFSLLSRTKSFSDEMARFYASCVLEALAFLHSRKIVFRDLKPENVVLDRQGYCKLTDFGFAKKLSKNSSLRTYTYCGTPEYMAPETILYHAQSFPVDLWTFGVFIFEMLDGKAPFRNTNRVALADSILAGIEPMLQISRDAGRINSTAAISLIKELCRTRPEDRLGAGKGGVSQIAKHSWFHKTSWQALRKRLATPPWKPELSSLKDMRYFKALTKSMLSIEAEEEFSGWDEHF